MPIGRYIADFVAVGVRLVVEVDGAILWTYMPATLKGLVDGAYHANRHAADARRDRALARLGYRVLRLEAALVFERPLKALARVRAALA